MKPTECEGLLVCLQFVEEGWYPGFKPKSYPATPGLEGVGKVGLTSSLILLITYTMGGPFGYLAVCLITFHGRKHVCTELSHKDM